MQLKQRVQELEVEVQQKEELSGGKRTSENRFSNSKKNPNITVLPAQIIGRDPSVWFNSSIINRGSLDGVKLNMPVVTNGGLVGRVTAVSPLTAQIDLVTKEKSGLGGVIGELGTSNALGVINGTGKKELLEMRYVPGSVEVKVGDMVYTTGQDGIYPAGLENRRNCRSRFRFGDRRAHDFNQTERKSIRCRKSPFCFTNRRRARI